MQQHLTIIESPYAGDITRNEQYARACVRDSIERGEIPFASHILYTQPGILDDTNESERRKGIELGHEFYHYAERAAVYVDLGISSGMDRGVEIATLFNVPVEYRTLKEWI